MLVSAVRESWPQSIPTENAFYYALMRNANEATEEEEISSSIECRLRRQTDKLKC